jgi:hypothetical protein
MGTETIVTDVCDICGKKKLRDNEKYPRFEISLNFVQLAPGYNTWESVLGLFNSSRDNYEQVCKSCAKEFYTLIRTWLEDKKYPFKDLNPPTVVNLGGILKENKPGITV